MGKRTYTQEQDAFLKKHPILDRVILTALFNCEFGTSKSNDAIRNHCRRQLGLKMVNRTVFSRGATPWNAGLKGYVAPGCEKGWFKPNSDHLTKGVGHERMKEGFIVIKVTNENKIARRNFKLKHRWVWENHHGKIPEGMIVSFKDNDKTNCEIDNLELIPRGEFTRLQKVYGWKNEHPDLKPIIRTIAAIDKKINSIVTT
jgi:hypothetical protein